MSKKNYISEINGTSDSLEMANQINSFFCDIGPTLASKIPNSLLRADYSKLPNLEPFELSMATFDEVKSLILNILIPNQMAMMESPSDFSRAI